MRAECIPAEAEDCFRRDAPGLANPMKNFTAALKDAVRLVAKNIAVRALCCALSLGSFSASAKNVVPTGEVCVINVRADDKLNVRTHPDANSAVVTSISPAECGVIITGQCQPYWCPVEINSASGWANRRFISTVSPARYCVSGVASYDKLAMRAAPSVHALLLVELPSYQCNISLLPFSISGWQKIRLDDWEGWVTRRHLSLR